MAHEWDRGVLNASSWHGYEEVGTFTDADSMFAHADRSGAWPINLHQEALFTSAGLKAPLNALVAEYANHKARVVGCNGARYREMTVGDWRQCVEAAIAAGARPTGAFSLCGGSRVLATFEVGVSNGLRTNLLLADSFDGSLKLTAGFTTIRVVCANTLAVSLRQDGAGMAALRHTASLETKVNALKEGIADAVTTGQKVKDQFERASRMVLNREQAQKAFDALFPEGDKEDSKQSVTRAKTAREDARIAATMKINKVGDVAGNLGTLWNAATYLVDRNSDGTERKARGDADSLNSLLFGTRAKRIQDIQMTIDAILIDGTVQPMTVTEALEHGIDKQAIARTLLEDILNDYTPPTV